METNTTFKRRSLWLLMAAALFITLFFVIMPGSALAADSENFTIKVSKSSRDYGDYGQSASEFVISGDSEAQVYCASVGRRFAGSSGATAEVGDTANLTFGDIDTSAGNYGGRLSDSAILLIKKALYYGAGGPEDMLTSSYGYDQAYQITHFVIAAADGYSAPDHYLPTGGDMANFKSAIQASAAPPSGFKVYRYVGYEKTGEQSDGQNMILWQMANGTLAATKTSVNPTISDGNNLYTVEGAEYTVYSGGSSVGKLTIGSDGTSNSLTLETGEYTVKETKAGTGYALDPETYTVSVAAGEEAKLTLTDKPQNDPVNIFLQKKDAKTGERAQGGGTLGGAQFTVKYYAGLYTESNLPGSATRTWVFKTDSNGRSTYTSNTNYFVSGDALYTDSAGGYTLPLGTVTIQETTAPTGYKLNDELFVRQITSEGSAESVFTFNDGDPVELKEQIIVGGVKIQKVDSDSNEGTPQGDATLAGAEFDIVSLNSNPVVVDGTEYSNGQTVKTITTNAQGIAATTAQTLPYGKYKIVEKTAPTGYLKNTGYSQEFNITEDGKVVDLTTKPCKDTVIRGGVKIQKTDKELGRAEAQGDASLAGAKFDIISLCTNDVYVDGSLFSNGDVVKTITTNASGVASTPAKSLPYGKYKIVEADPSTGYLLNDGFSEQFEITEDGKIVDLTTKPCEEQVIRGGADFLKYDIELHINEALGGASLEGIEITLTNASPGVIVYDGTEIASGAVVDTYLTDAEGKISLDGKTLPYGTYTIKETKTNDSYLLTATGTLTFTVREDGAIVTQDTDENDLVFENQVKRNDFQFNKIADGSNERMANVAFLVTQLKTGEKHVIVTDRNGSFSSDAYAHSSDTNANDAILESYDLVNDVVPSSELNYKAGVWFAVGEKGSEAAVDDDLCALPYGDYRLTEIRCEANEGYKLLDFEFYVERDGSKASIIDLGTLTDDEMPQISIGTKATAQETETHEVQAGDSVTIIDTVSYTNLTVGEEYTLKGDLIDANTGDPLADEGYTVECEDVTFKADAETGEIEMTFTVSGGDLAGIKTVVFERLVQGNLVVAKHEDIEDEGQMVNIIDIGTSASGVDTTSDTIEAAEEVTIIDYVEYTGLIVGKKHTVEGTLMNAETGKDLKEEGFTYKTQAVEFTPEEPDGTVEVRFTIDTTQLEGQKIVVFEDLYYDGIKVATHADITDEEQTVTVETPEVPTPEIGTTATSEDGGKAIAVGKEIVLKDVIAYSGLTPGEEYTIEGTLMNAETGKQLSVQGATLKTTFTPDAEDGEYTVLFTVDTRSLGGASIVVFEDLSLNGELVAKHHDITDKGQTVTVKKISIGTTATIGGEKSAEIASETVITDTVDFKGLTTGKEYTLSGVLMDKETGKAVLIGGEEVRNERKFIAPSENGAINITFTLNSLGLDGKDVVVFESLLLDGIEIASHADLKDEGQTVHFNGPTPTPMPKTGDETDIMPYIIIAIIAAAAIAVMLVLKKKGLLARTSK